MRYTHKDTYSVWLILPAVRMGIFIIIKAFIDRIFTDILPYIKNENAYHQYEALRDFSELSDVVRTCKDEKLIEALKADAKRYGIDLENLEIYGGKIAGHKPFHSDGGGDAVSAAIKYQVFESTGICERSILGGMEYE